MTGKRVSFSCAILLFVWAYASAQTQPKKEQIPLIEDPYSKWIKVEADNGGFTALFPSPPKYVKSYYADRVMRQFTGAIPSQEIIYQVLYLDLDFVYRGSPSEFLGGVLKSAPESKIVKSVVVSLNEVPGIEDEVVTPNEGYSRMLCFVSGKDVYILSFRTKSEKGLSAHAIEYFLKHFNMQPIPAVVGPRPRNRD